MNHNKPTNEEIDILDFFKAIGAFFKSIFDSIGSFIKIIFFLFLKFLIFLKKNSLYLGIGIVAGIIFAFIFNKDYEVEYKSNIYVKLNYDSYPALQAKIESVNSLLKDENYKALSKELKIKEDQARKLKYFELNPIYNDIFLLKDYENYIKSLDTSTYKFMEFNDFKKEIKSQNAFPTYNIIKVKATSPYVFSSLNSYFKSALEDIPVLKQKQENQLTYLKQKVAKINQSLTEIDSLRQVLNKVYLAEANHSTSSGVVVNNATKNSPEKTYDLFEKRMSLLKELKFTMHKLMEKKHIVLPFNTFPEVGQKVSMVSYNPYIKYPVYGFLFALFILLLLQLNRILNHYQNKWQENEID